MNKKVFFKNKSGLKLCGIWHIPKNKTDKAIILAHGINVDKDELGVFIHLANRLQKNGYVVFRFDFRGHGESEGNSLDMRIAGEIEDLEAAVDEVLKNGYNKIGLLGASFGGPVAVFYAAKEQKKLKCLCLSNPCLNYDHCILNPATSFLMGKTEKWNKDLKEKGWTTIGRNSLKISSRLFDEMKTLFPYEELKKITIPTVIVHGTADTYVPYSDSKEYIKYLKNGKLISLEGVGHGFQEDNEKNYETSEAIIKTVEFFKNNL